MRRSGEDERWREGANRKSGSTILYLTFTPVEQGTRRKSREMLKKDVNHVRIINEDRLASFRKELNFQSWDNVLKTNDVNHAYGTFLHIFIHLFNKHCAVITVLKKSCINKNQWFTNGLKCACTKKKRLYKAFIISQSSEADLKYKTKTNLTSVLRCSEKTYYSELLEKQKNNVTGTWKILNTIINKQFINMSMVKTIITEIVKPLNHICNLSKQVCFSTK